MGVEAWAFPVGLVLAEGDYILPFLLFYSFLPSQYARSPGLLFYFWTSEEMAEVAV